MVKKQLPLIFLMAGLLLLALAAGQYPGGSQFNKLSKGYSWLHNYLCNLFGEQAVNGENNPGRYYAMAGMLMLCITLALLFHRIARKAASVSLERMIRWSGTGAMAAAFLVVTPLHDMMTTISCTLALLTFFGMIVSLWKEGHFWLLVAGIVNMLLLYFTSYVYYSGQWLYLLPVLQKLSFLLTTGWLFTLHYYLPQKKQASARAL